MSTAVVERSWTVMVPHHPKGAGQARGRIAASLAATVNPELLADAVSIIAELVGNAIRHGQPLPGDVVRVAWSVRHVDGTEVVDIRVSDGGAMTDPVVRPPDPDSTEGRGLAIVAALADHWGFARDGLGQSVWARISVPRRGARRRVGWRPAPAAPSI